VRSAKKEEAQAALEEAIPLSRKQQQLSDLKRDDIHRGRSFCELLSTCRKLARRHVIYRESRRTLLGWNCQAHDGRWRLLKSVEFDKDGLSDTPGTHHAQSYPGDKLLFVILLIELSIKLAMRTRAECYKSMLSAEPLRHNWHQLLTNQSVLCLL
jgi:hypothetical protein